MSANLTAPDEAAERRRLDEVFDEARRRLHDALDVPPNVGASTLFPPSPTVRAAEARLRVMARALRAAGIDLPDGIKPYLPIATEDSP